MFAHEDKMSGFLYDDGALVTTARIVSQPWVLILGPLFDRYTLQVQKRYFDDKGTFIWQFYNMGTDLTWAQTDR